MIKDFIFRFSSVFSSKNSLTGIMKLTQRNIILPFYHCVSNENPVHIKHLYKIKTVAEFEKDLDFFLSLYKPISYDELLALENKNQTAKPCFHLSFDDGLQEVYTVIAPILKRRGIPATIFTNSAFIGNKNLFHRYKVSIIIDSVLNNKKIINHLKHKFDIHSNIVNYLLSMQYMEMEIINRIAAELDIDFNRYLSKKKPYLSEEQVRELIRNGFTLGAHSDSHPEYWKISLQDQILQTEQSIQYLKNTFGLQRVPFAFPFTDDQVQKLFYEKMKGKFEASFGTAGLKNDPLSNHFQRIAMENGIPAKDIIWGEYFYYLLKIPLKANNYKRQ